MDDSNIRSQGDMIRRFTKDFNSFQGQSILKSSNGIQEEALSAILVGLSEVTTHKIGKYLNKTKGMVRDILIECSIGFRRSTGNCWKVTFKSGMLLVTESITDLIWTLLNATTESKLISDVIEITPQKIDLVFEAQVCDLTLFVHTAPQVLYSYHRGV